ncbi:MAG: DUF2059 domain-containing protein [Pseudomonadales bacterium]
MRSPLCTATIVFCFLTLGSPAQAEDPAVKRAAAERYLAATPISEMIESTTNEMAKQLAPEQRDRFREVMLNSVDVERLEQITLEAMIDTFTTEELNAFADFYGSAVGKSALAKFGIYMGKVSPPLQQEMLRALEASQTHEHSP